MSSMLHRICLFLPPAVDAQLDDVGLSFMKNSISAIETRGELQICNYRNDQLREGGLLYILT